MLARTGGPGGSSITTLPKFIGRWAKQWPGYNFVSFDPRGVGLTRPKLDCKLSKLAKRNFYPMGNLSALFEARAHMNELCYQNTKDDGAKYVGTLANVFDMMHFTEMQAKARGQDLEKAMINYYGASYGTIMGQTLVATFPDRLRRVLLDANSNGLGWYQGWTPNTDDDFSHGVYLFSKLCLEAGEKLCPLAHNATSCMIPRYQRPVRPHRRLSPRNAINQGRIPIHNPKLSL